MTNNNISPYKQSPEKPEDIQNLSDVAFNVDLKTLKERSRQQREKNKMNQREKPGFDNYWVAYRAVNNLWRSYARKTYFLHSYRRDVIHSNPKSNIHATDLQQALHCMYRSNTTGLGSAGPSRGGVGEVSKSL